VPETVVPEYGPVVLDLGRIPSNTGLEGETLALCGLWYAVSNRRGATAFLVEWTTLYVDTGNWYAREMRYDREAKVLRDFSMDCYWQYAEVTEWCVQTLAARSYATMVSQEDLVGLGCQQTWHRSRLTLPFRNEWMAFP